MRRLNTTGVMSFGWDPSVQQIMARKTVSAVEESGAN